MPALNYGYLIELEEYIRSGGCADDFLYSPEERRLEMLNFLEKLMDLGELADEVATKIIFRKHGEMEKTEKR
jgi:hypothetical protein